MLITATALTTTPRRHLVILIYPRAVIAITEMYVCYAVKVKWTMSQYGA